MEYSGQRSDKVAILLVWKRCQYRHSIISEVGQHTGKARWGQRVMPRWVHARLSVCRMKLRGENIDCHFDSEHDALEL